VLGETLGINHNNSMPKEQEEDTQEEAVEHDETETHTRCAGRGKLRIQVDWPDNPVEWPDTQARWDEEYPVLLFPWYGQKQAQYDPNTGLVHVQDGPPFSSFSFDSPDVLLGELRDGNRFVANDLFIEDEDANQRAHKLINLPGVPDEVEVVRPVQVTDTDNFNRYLESFKQQGYVGVLVRKIEDLNDAPQYIVISEL